MKPCRPKVFFLEEIFNYKYNFFVSIRLFRLSNSSWISFLVICVFQDICSFHLNCRIYGHTVVCIIPFLAFSVHRNCSDSSSFITYEYISHLYLLTFINFIDLFKESNFDCFALFYCFSILYVFISTLIFIIIVIISLLPSALGLVFSYFSTSLRHQVRLLIWILFLF